MKKLIILGVMLCVSVVNTFATDNCSAYYTETHNPGYGGSVSAEQMNDCEWTITALPVVDYSFAGWNDGNFDNPRTIIIDPEVSTITYTATFLPVTHSTSGSGGKIIAEPVENSCDWIITAVPSDGYAFLKWEDDSFTNPRTITGAMITAQASYTATFITSDAAIDGWTADKMVVRTKKVNIGTSTATIYTNGEQRATGLALTSVDAGYWSMTLPASLNSYAGQPLKIIFNCGGDPVSTIDSIVPYVVSTNTNISTISANTDVEVVSGTLTMDAASSTIATLDIYPDAKAVVPDGKDLTVNAIYMRANAMDGLYPQLVANGGIANTSDTIYYDYTLDYSAFYPLAVPYDVLCSNIRTSTGRAASFEIRQYDGAVRADSGEGWEVLDDQDPGAQLNAGEGYIVFAVPYKWNGTRQSRVTVRFPMVADLSSGEAEKSTPVSLYNGEVPADRNWNFLGNPYLATFTTGDNNMIMEENGVRYITTTTDGYRTYTQSRVTDEIAIKPFNTFFIQAAAAGDLEFDIEQRAQSAPSRSRATYIADEPAFGLILRAGGNTDRTGLLYGESFSDGYEMNADLVKLSGSSPVMELYTLAGNDKRAYNALSTNDITRPVALGFANAKTGEMTIAFDSNHYAAEPFSAVMLIDHETGQTVNLLDGEYRFTSTRSQNDTRFTVHALRAPQILTGLSSQTVNEQTVNVYDILGRRVSGNRLPQGIYIIVENGENRKEVIR